MNRSAVVNHSAPILASRPIGRRAWLIGCLLVLIAYYVTRLPNLLSLPLFIDEATHLTRAQAFWQGQPLDLLLNGKAGPLYLIALFDPFNAPIGLGRLVIVLCGGLGVASAIGTARLIGGRSAGLLAGILWVCCPYLFFYERMILVDAPLAAFATFAAWTCIRMMRTERLIDALLCGFALVLCAFDKVTGLVFFALPVVALIWPGLTDRATLIRRIRQVIVTYGLAGLIMIVPALVIASQQVNIFGVGALTSTSPTGLSGRLSGNATLTLNAFQTYLGATLLILLIVGALVAIGDRPRRALIGLAMVVVPLISLMAVGQMLYIRYLVIGVPGLLILGAVGGSVLGGEVARWMALPTFRRTPIDAPQLLTLTFAALALLIATLLPFARTAYTDPASLRLPLADQQEYIQMWSGGYGLRDVALDLLAQAQANQQPITAIGMVGSCDTIRLYVPIDSQVTILCPDVWDASGAGMRLGEQEIDSQRTAKGSALVIGEDNGPVNILAVPQPNTIVQTYPRPSGYNTVDLFSVKRAAP